MLWNDWFCNVIAPYTICYEEFKLVNLIFVDSESYIWIAKAKIWILVAILWFVFFSQKYKILRQKMWLFPAYIFQSDQYNTVKFIGRSNPLIIIE